MRISEAQARKLGIKADGKVKKARIPSSVDAERPKKGRSRHARTRYDVEPVTITVMLPYDPRPKERPRTAVNREALKSAFLRANGSLARFMEMAVGITNTYTPKRTLDYENLLKAEARIVMMRRLPIDVPVEADIVLTLDGDPETWPTSGLDGDGDNLQKAVLDALNEIVFTDDRLVVRKSVIKECGPKPSVTVHVRAATP